MEHLDPKGLSRRSVLRGTGSLLLSFALTPVLAQTITSPGDETQNFKAQPTPAPDLPGSLKTSPHLDSWIRVDAQGGITVFTGKAELGQGIRTALTQIAAEELKVPFQRIVLITPGARHELPALRGAGAALDGLS